MKKRPAHRLQRRALARDRQTDERAVRIYRQADGKELLDAVKSKDAALGIAAISITADREVELDFSQPMFDAGLQILTPVQGGRGGVVEAIMANLLSTTVLLYVLGVAFDSSPDGAFGVVF